MKLLDYIRGLRKGKEAHRLEKESMKDPFQIGRASCRERV